MPSNAPALSGAPVRNTLGSSVSLRRCSATATRPPKILAAIGKRIRQLRGTERQDDFAPFLGITQGQLSKMERGIVSPTVEVLLRLRKHYGKSVDWFLTGED